MLLTATLRTDDGDAVGIIVLREKVFRSGKAGFHGVGKLELDGQRYQAQAQLVAIASKGGSGGKGDGVPPGISAAVDVLRGRVSREALSDSGPGFVGEPGEEAF